MAALVERSACYNTGDLAALGQPLAAILALPSFGLMHQLANVSSAEQRGQPRRYRGEQNDDHEQHQAHDHVRNDRAEDVGHGDRRG
jgi:hypothetical protein